MQDQINYSELIDNAMRGVVRDVLRRVHRSGLPGEHHFYVTFRTDHPGTRVSDTLKARYPQEMTIVLQHQFWDFKVEEQQFQATLSFGGVPEKLVVPYAALTAFADPSIKFGLQFQPPEEDGDVLALLNESEADEFAAISEPAEDSPAEIISLDAFRKK